MLTKYYQFALFSPQGKLLFSSGLRGWGLLLLPTLIAALTGSVIFLHGYYAEYQDQQQSLQQMRVDMEQLSEALIKNAFDLSGMENTLASVEDFNAKMRVMLNMGDENDNQETLIRHPRTRLGLSYLPALYGRNITRHLKDKAQTLGETILREEIKQQEIAHSISRQLEKLATIPVIMPTRGRFSSPFGWRKDPFKGTRRFHKGIDITARTGTPIRATANGFITQVSVSPSYGLVIMLKHSEELTTRYAHLSRFAVEEGQHVLRGQVIGYVGNSGRSKAPHLHYEVYVKDKPVNPRNYILQ